MIGAGMIGAAHAFGYRTHMPHFAKRLPGLRLGTVCDGNAALATQPAFYEIARFDGSGQSPFSTVANHPALPHAQFLPVPHDGVAIGYAEVFGFMMRDFLEAIAENRPIASGTILDGVRAAEVLDAIQQAADINGPVTVDRRHAGGDTLRCDHDLQHGRPDSPAARLDPASYERIRGVVFTFGIVAFAGWMVTTCVLQRRETAAEIRATPEYRCLAVALGRAPRIAPKAVVKPQRTDRSYGAGTLAESRGTDCVPDGDAVTYALVPVPGGREDLVRIPGRDVLTEHREPGAWADLVAEGGRRWRNDGGGYRSVPR